MQIFRRHGSENSVTAAIVSSNDGHHDGQPPGAGHEADQGHNGSYRPVQMYSTVQSNSSDPAASQQTQVTPRRIGRREKLASVQKCFDLLKFLLEH